MALIQCSKSGITFNCEHLPLAISSNYSISHPLFSLPQKKLLSLAGQWSARKLSSTESYLLYLALLDSTELVQWRTAAQHTPPLDAIIENSMEKLLTIIGKINLIKSPSLVLPTFVISADTSNLGNSHHWIETWTESYHEWYDGYSVARKQSALAARLEAREEALQRLIKSSASVDSYADKLADWAAIAGSFPTYETNHPLTGLPIQLDAYWKQIIRAIANDDKFWRYPKKDIEELVDHCEDNITQGNIYSHTLMKYLRKGTTKHGDFFGFDTAPATTRFTVISTSTDNLGDASAINLAAMIQKAPEDEPKKHQYASNFAWLKAFTQWKMAQKSRTR